MKIITKLLGFIFVLVIQSCLVTDTKFTSIVLADEGWKNFHAISWRGDADENIRYARQMGYDYIGISRA
ncbi:MAG: hypothetical protein HRF42_06425, partial [Candidatus Brocadia sp.]